MKTHERLCYLGHFFEFSSFSGSLLHVIGVNSAMTNSITANDNEVIVLYIKIYFNNKE